MLRSDMVDIVARITNIEYRLNESISPCLQCKCLQNQQVMLSRYTTILRNISIIIFYIQVLARKIETLTFPIVILQVFNESSTENPPPRFVIGDNPKAGNTEKRNITLPFQELSAKTIVVILAWPFIVNAISSGVKTTAKHLSGMKQLEVKDIRISNDNFTIY